MDDVRETLSHVMWIGGAPNAGKTTLSRLLAGKYDLKLYNLDWHGAREHRQRPGEASAEFERLTMDERWLDPTPERILERSIARWTESFAIVVDDLLALPRSRPILAEGPGAFPWCVAEVIRSPRQAIFLLPTSDFRERVLEKRARREKLSADGTSDPERARSNIRARDVLLAERIAASCVELGLRCERVDGSLDLDDSVELLEEQLKPYLPDRVNA